MTPELNKKIDLLRFLVYLHLKKMGQDSHSSLTLSLQTQHVNRSHYSDKAAIAFVLLPAGRAADSEGKRDG